MLNRASDEQGSIQLKKGRAELKLGVYRHPRRQIAIMAHESFMNGTLLPKPCNNAFLLSISILFHQLNLSIRIDFFISFFRFRS
jgi:hypothetical protein